MNPAMAAAASAIASGQTESRRAKMFRAAWQTPPRPTAAKKAEQSAFS